MPPISRFFGIVIQMFWNEHGRRTSTPNMASTRQSSTFKRWNRWKEKCPDGR